MIKMHDKARYPCKPIPNADMHRLPTRACCLALSAGGTTIAIQTVSLNPQMYMGMLGHILYVFTIKPVGRDLGPSQNML